jgi:hypothetical protein
VFSIHIDILRVYLLYSLSFTFNDILFLFLSAVYFISFPFLVRIIFIYTPLRVKRGLSVFTNLLSIFLSGCLSARLHFVDSWLFE